MFIIYEHNRKMNESQVINSLYEEIMGLADVPVCELPVIDVR